MDTNLNSKNNVGVVLVGHGSRLPYGKDVVSQIADAYREKTNYLVEIGFMNMSKPSIPTAINNLADKGVDKIIVTPVFLAHGVHTKQDIPHILGLDNGQDQGHNHPQHQEHGHNHEHSHHDQEVEEIQFKGEIIYTEPLGADRRISDIIKDRVDNAL